MTKSRLGPCLSATLTTPGLEASIRAYCDFLHQHLASRGVVSTRQAHHWGLESLAGAPFAWLANDLNESWLRLIEVPGTQPLDPFFYSGWFALEINVQEVDELYVKLKNSPFRVIGEPANLDVSDNIRAMQLIGPAGEVLYLTQLKAEVPPFQLPFARCAVDRVFIPVLLTTNRGGSLADYEKFPGTHGVEFETKITVINRARKLDLNQRHPVATIQLRGDNLIEIDQLEGLSARPSNSGGLSAGITMISVAVRSIPPAARNPQTADGIFADNKAVMTQGSAGELIELIETDTND